MTTLRHRVTARPEYNVWEGIVQRCENPRNDRYGSYGGRGIRMYPAWRVSFAAFLADVGPRPSPRHSIDRIDVNGSYVPGNVRWATAREQQRNRRTNRRYTLHGETLLLCEWAERLGVPPHTIATRIARGWPMWRALTETPTPKDGRSRTCKVCRARGRRYCAEHAR